MAGWLVVALVGVRVRARAVAVPRSLKPARCQYVGSTLSARCVHTVSTPSTASEHHRPGLPEELCVGMLCP